MGAPAAQGLLGQGGPMDWQMVQHILGLNGTSPLMLPYDPSMTMAANDGVSVRTKKALVDSAGFDPNVDFGDNPPMPAQPQYYQGAPTSKKEYTPRTMTPAEAAAEQKRLNAEADANRLRNIQNYRRK